MPPSETAAARRHKILPPGTAFWCKLKVAKEVPAL